MGQICQLWDVNGIYPDAVIRITRLLNIGSTGLVEITKNPNGDLIVSRVKTNAEMRKEWKESELPNIPKHVRFLKDGNTVVAYYQKEGKQKSAFAICDPKDEFDFDLGKCIAYWRLCNRTLPPYIYSD